MAGTWVPTAYLTDSRAVQAYYRAHFKSEPAYIPYGSDVEPLPPGRYFAPVRAPAGRLHTVRGRLVPENNVHHLLEAFRGLGTDKRCVVVGDAPYGRSLHCRIEGDGGGAGNLHRVPV